MKLALVIVVMAAGLAFAEDTAIEPATPDLSSLGEAELRTLAANLYRRIAELERENAALRDAAPAVAPEPMATPAAPAAPHDAAAPKDLRSIAQIFAVPPDVLKEKELGNAAFNAAREKWITENMVGRTLTIRAKVTAAGIDGDKMEVQGAPVERVRIDGQEHEARFIGAPADRDALAKFVKAKDGAPIQISGEIKSVETHVQGGHIGGGYTVQTAPVRRYLVIKLDGLR